MSVFPTVLLVFLVSLCVVNVTHVGALNVVKLNSVLFVSCTD